ncbi:MAG: DUF5924 family protein [Candidatus Rokuibacteriota bacterium]
MSIASLAGGLVALFVFRRGLPHVGWIVGYVVVLWLCFTVLTQARAWFEARGRHLLVAAGDYTVQTLYHGLLLFILPGYFASTTFDAITAPFFLVLAVAALITTIDPWYRAIVGARPWLGRVFFAFVLFAGLNVALSLVGLRPARALIGGALLGPLALLPADLVIGNAWLRVALRTGLSAATAGALAWILTPAIPPVPLHLVSPTMTRAVVDFEPVGVLGSSLSAALLAEGSGLVAYTPVSAPAGLQQPIAHRWRHEGRLVETVPLPTPVRGGRAAGFRTYSRKTDFPPAARGRWSVDVVTAGGQLIGRLRFAVGP